MDIIGAAVVAAPGIQSGEVMEAKVAVVEVL
jgi:hypothetical protein